MLVLRGFKLVLSFLLTTRRMEETVAAVSSLAAAAPSGWTPAITQWATKLHVKFGKKKKKHCRRTNPGGWDYLLSFTLLSHSVFFNCV